MSFPLLLWHAIWHGGLRDHRAAIDLPASTEFALALPLTVARS
jgi:hypothetical protein